MSLTQNTTFAAKEHKNLFRFTQLGYEVGKFVGKCVGDIEKLNGLLNDGWFVGDSDGYSVGNKGGSITVVGSRVGVSVRTDAI